MFKRKSFDPLHPSADSRPTAFKPRSESHFVEMRSLALSVERMLESARHNAVVECVDAVLDLAAHSSDLADFSSKLEDIRIGLGAVARHLTYEPPPVVLSPVAAERSEPFLSVLDLPGKTRRRRLRRFSTFREATAFGLSSIAHSSEDAEENRDHFRSFSFTVWTQRADAEAFARLFTLRVHQGDVLEVLVHETKPLPSTHPMGWRSVA